MSESPTEKGSQNANDSVDLEKGHAVPGQLPREDVVVNADDQGLYSESSSEYDVSRHASARSVFSTSTSGDNPFGLFPAITLSMSSTKAPHRMSIASRGRRSTGGTIGRPLTRAETRQTLRTIRSRFTEVRDEFDENVRKLHDLTHFRMTFPSWPK
jgi:hypothetical protein